MSDTRRQIVAVIEAIDDHLERLSKRYRAHPTIGLSIRIYDLRNAKRALQNELSELVAKGEE